LPDIQVVTHLNRLFSEPPTVGGQHLENTFSHMIKCCIWQGSVVLLFRCGGQSRLQFVIFWDNAHNQK